MSPNCIDVERIADVQSSPELRQHVADCPRCESLWLSYQTFMTADVSGAPRADDARRSLDAVIRRQAGRAAVDEVPRVSRLATRRRAELSWLRPGLIAAVAAVVAVVAISVWRGSTDQPVLRGGSEATWSLQAPRVSGPAVVFTWGAVPDADAYEVEIFDDALNLVLHSASVITPTISVDRSAFVNIQPGTELSWRIRALRGGDVLATSPPASLTLK
ncbi:MAG TPA: hypothetical protein VFH33_03130 [Candidatus Krumholzibacteria bacterium]|nr:hypothetical protein [Candidatus Krumholzibacteria bacterium]